MSKKIKNIGKNVPFIYRMHPLILNKGLDFQPVTTQVGDARIYWQLVVKVYTTFGFKFNYKTEFTVTKEKSTT